MTAGESVVSAPVGRAAHCGRLGACIRWKAGPGMARVAYNKLCGLGMKVHPSCITSAL
jgi:hypothetical protein